jgi:hypothetical protein
MSWINHFCHECKLKFLKAKDYVLHHNDHHLDHQVKLDRRDRDPNP